MARKIIDIAIVEVDGKVLHTIESLEVEENDPGAEPVKTMNPNRRAIGFKEGVPDFQVSIDARKQQPPEFPWHEYRNNGTIFPIVYEENLGGDRYVLRDCKVISISKSFNQDGEAMDRVSIQALDHQPE